ncbi:hypothetical protein LCGC14_1934690 [marine sediment metagenome]|uniref:Uncharacterized protein n=1 Tax=marine sediment metagenome TaxID=412755 RepID=A0A0F9FMH4_9ZZZZ
MATDTSFGAFREFEDFNVTAIADKPEVDITAIAGGTTEVIAGDDGRIQINGDGGNDEQVGAVSFGRVMYTAGNAWLKMEARLYLDTIADYKIYVGFGDSLASASETSMSATSDVVSSNTMSDGIAILKDGDSTTDALWAVAQNGDSVTVGQVLDSIYNPSASTFTTLGCYLSLDRKSAVWYVDGTEVYRVDGSTLLVDAVALVPGVWCYDQATGTNHVVDYLYGSKGRSAA